MKIKVFAKSKLTGNFGVFLYKIMEDILTVLLVSFGIVLIGESAMPGLFASHLSFTDLIAIIFPIMIFMAYLGKLNGITFKFKNKKTAFVGSLALFSAMLTANSLLKFDMWEIAVITIASLALLYFLFNIFSESNK